MKRIRPRLLRRWGVAALAGGIVLGTGAVASADSLGPINFEPGVHRRQHQRPAGMDEDGPLRRCRRSDRGLSRGRPATSSAPRPCASRMRSRAAASATRRSRPGSRTRPARHRRSRTSRRASGSGPRSATEQPGLHMSVSPDDGNGVADELPALRGSGRRRPRLLRRRHRSRARSATGRDVQRDRDRDLEPRRRPTRSGSRSTSGQGPRTTWSRSTSTDAEDQGNDLGGLLPLRPGADRQRQRGPDGQQAALPR